MSPCTAYTYLDASNQAGRIAKRMRYTGPDSERVASKPVGVAGLNEPGWSNSWKQ